MNEATVFLGGLIATCILFAAGFVIVWIKESLREALIVVGTTVGLIVGIVALVFLSMLAAALITGAAS